MMTQHNKNKQTPTETIQKWIRDFVTKPNPIFGDLPPCPYAQRAIVENKVEFVELNRTADWRTIYQLIWNTDFDDKDVLCVIADPRQFTAQETVGIAEALNERFMSRDIVILEDHPDIEEKVKSVTLNNGHYTLFLAQRLSKLNKFSKMLESGPYYRNWSKTYLEAVKGFRDPGKNRS
jgi:hypothetical protein